MNKELLYAEATGIRIISDDVDIAIDPVSLTQGSFPHAIIFSGLKSAARGKTLHGNKENIPVFTSSHTKKLLIRANSKFDTENFPSAEEIISCTPNRKTTLRKDGNPVAEFTFFSPKEFPANSHVLIKTKTRNILYTADIRDKGFKMPTHDTLIICANKKTPVKEIISKVGNVVIKTENFSDLSDVLCFFNQEFKGVSVGIDSTITNKAYEYLKADCTVFSNTIKPLSSFAHMPPVIITADETLYTDRFCMFSSDFQKELSLADVYEFTKSSCAKTKIAICHGLNSIRKRGDITLCCEGSIIEL